MEFDQTNPILLRMTIIICLLNHFATFLDRSFKPKTRIKNRNISIDSFQQHTNSNRKFPLFDLVMYFLTNIHSFISSNNIELIDFSLH